MASVDNAGACTGELVVTRDDDHVELCVHSPKFPQPRLYAYALTDPVQAFCNELAADLAKAAGNSAVPVMELRAASSAVISPMMSHAYAWKTGRWVDAGGDCLSVRIVGAASGDKPGDMPQQHSTRDGRRPTKYVVVTGGVVSGLGKGLTASSLGVLLTAAGYRVTSIKIDPYLNVDAGTMSPFEHGEVFTLDDGGECDLDLGNYERFIGTTLTRDNNITTGKIYQSCLEKERRGDYLGKTVQVVPHVTDMVMEWIERVAHVPTDGLEGAPDICVIELGGTVGDIESAPFVEALRQFQFRVGRDNMCFFHVSLVPVLGSVGEEKTKPTQHTVQTLRSVGLAADFLVCRSSKPLSAVTKQKLANFCHVEPACCLGVHDVSNIYRVPLLLHNQGVTHNLLTRLSLPMPANFEQKLSSWISLAELVDSLHVEVSIAVVGKYTELSDAYLSVSKALLHASFAVERKLAIRWISADHLDDEAREKEPDAYAAAWAKLKGSDGVLVPGGFGIRAVEGKCAAAKYARESKKPYLGICLGFQVGVIEYARSVLNLKDAHSAEFDEATPHPLVVFMPEVSRTQMGGTMRLGSRRTVLRTPQCVTARMYGGVTAFDERHRHRYEVNIKYVKQLEASGMQFVGRDTTGERMEVFELDGHPYYLGCQFHPEFKSRPNKPSPLFLGLLHAASGMPLPK